jgi:putative transposase
MPSHYDPSKHHRRSIRLKGYDYTSAGAYFITICTHHRQPLFGEITNGAMQLSQFGQIVRSHWLKLPNHYPHVQLDEFIIMPDHVHGILKISDPSGGAVGAGLTNPFSDPIDRPIIKPAPTGTSPHPDRHGIPEIVRGFKTFSARRINQIRQTKGTPVWQRNYYERIIRDDRALHTIRRYIQTNPSNWCQTKRKTDLNTIKTECHHNRQD